MAKKKKGLDWDRIKKAVKGAGVAGGKAADWYFGADLKKGGNKKGKFRGVNRQTDVMGERFDVTPDDLFGFGRERRNKRQKRKKKKRKKDNIKVIVIRG